MYSLSFRFFAVNVLITYLYMSMFQKVDEEEYGGISEILKEGLMTSFSSFLVSFEISPPPPTPRVSRPYLEKCPYHECE